MCKEGDPDAVIKFHKGDVIRSIETHFGFRKTFVMSKTRFKEMREQIIEYMDNYFDECGCTVDNTVLLGRYIGDYLMKYTNCVRHRNAIYNAVFRALEKELYDIYQVICTYNNRYLEKKFIETVESMRNFQSGNNVYVAFPGYPGHKFGKVTVAFAGNYKVFKDNISMMKSMLHIYIEEFLKCFSFVISRGELSAAA